MVPIAPKKRSPEMSNNMDRNGGRAHSGEVGMLRAAILLTLPFLSFQRDILHMLKTSLERRPKGEDGSTPANNSLVDLIHKLTARELQALMMVLDPSHAWRRGLGEDFQRKLADDISEISQQFAVGAANIIEVQSKTLDRVVELLRKIK
jgi:hypothetical protein